jgi:hypothetical protein
MSLSYFLTGVTHSIKGRARFYPNYDRDGPLTKRCSKNSKEQNYKNSSRPFPDTKHTHTHTHTHNKPMRIQNSLQFMQICRLLIDSPFNPDVHVNSTCVGHTEPSSEYTATYLLKTRDVGPEKHL